MFVNVACNFRKSSSDSLLFYFFYCFFPCHYYLHIIHTSFDFFFTGQNQRNYVIVGVDGVLAKWVEKCGAPVKLCWNLIAKKCKMLLPDEFHTTCAVFFFFFLELIFKNNKFFMLGLSNFLNQWLLLLADCSPCCGDRNKYPLTADGKEIRGTQYCDKRGCIFGGLFFNRDVSASLNIGGRLVFWFLVFGFWVFGFLGFWVFGFWGFRVFFVFFFA